VGILAIALNTFREGVRDKIFYAIVIFGIVVMASSKVISTLSLGQVDKISKDLGLATMSLLGLLVAVFVGTKLVYEEISRKTIYTIVSKPVTRSQFVIGKYLGLVLIIAVTLSILTGFFCLIVYLNLGSLDPPLLTAALLTFFELTVITSVAIFFSTFTSPISSALFTMGIWVAGHFSHDLKALGQISDSALARGVSGSFYYIIPNLSNFDIRGEVVHGIEIPSPFLLLSILYGLVYSAAVILVATLIFRRRNF
jgi:Cu-processing system permease protein